MKAKFINENYNNKLMIKPFEDVEKGDIGIDYHGEDVTIVDKGIIEIYDEDGFLTYDEDGFISNYSDPVIKEYIEELIENGQVSDGDDINVVAARLDNETEIFIYGDDGVFVPLSDPSPEFNKAKNFIESNILPKLSPEQTTSFMNMIKNWSEEWM